jgi:hypothetical protein
MPRSRVNEMEDGGRKAEGDAITQPPMKPSQRHPLTAQPRREKLRYDPNERIQSDWYRHYRQESVTTTMPWNRRSEIKRRDIAAGR